MQEYLLSVSVALCLAFLRDKGSTANILRKLEVLTGKLRFQKCYSIFHQSQNQPNKKLSLRVPISYFMAKGLLGGNQTRGNSPNASSSPGLLGSRGCSLGLFTCWARPEPCPGSLPLGRGCLGHRGSISARGSSVLPLDLPPDPAPKNVNAKRKISFAHTEVNGM